jgi:Methyltransferase domain
MTMARLLSPMSLKTQLSRRLTRRNSSSRRLALVGGATAGALTMVGLLTPDRRAKAAALGLMSGLSVSGPLWLLLEQNREMRQEARDLWGLAHVMTDGKAWLPPGGWALGADALIWLIREIDARGTKTIVELGPGASSVILGVSTEARIVGLEHDEHYVEILAKQLASNDVKNYELRHAPLERRTHDGDAIEWYAAAVVASLPSQIDVLIVDGPPNFSGGRNRSPALRELRDRLQPGALIVVDDTQRPAERAMVGEWLGDRGVIELHDGDTFMALEVLAEPGS